MVVRLNSARKWPKLRGVNCEIVHVLSEPHKSRKHCNDAKFGVVTFGLATFYFGFTRVAVLILASGKAFFS